LRTAACVTLVCALAFAAPARAASGVQGDQILNVAAVGADGLPVAITSSPAAVTVRIPTPATIELLQYAPGSARARPEALVPGVFRSGAGVGALFTPLPLPKLTGAPAALALPASLPLLVSGQFHAGDPVFIRLTDRDQNMDRNAREAVLVSITDELTGDAEVVRLTEDGPDTGVFTGYIPSARTGVSRQYDGLLQVVEKSVLTASYVDAFDPGDTSSARGVLDPSSRIFDSRTGKLVDGAEITVVDVSSGRPATLFSDDGVSSFPSTLLSGRTATDGAGRVHSFGPGEFRFPFLRPGTYRYDVKPPAGYTAPSKVADAALQAQPGAPFTLSDPGSRGGAFPLDPGPIVHFDIPVDPAAVKLWVEKTAAATRVGTGDFLSYQIAVTNLDPAATAGSVQAVDALPVGFRYRAGSAQSNGSPRPIRASARTDARSPSHSVTSRPPRPPACASWCRSAPARRWGRTPSTWRAPSPEVAAPRTWPGPR
jgi:uncharacterized repeat protein (TIGR01451 family)